MGAFFLALFVSTLQECEKLFDPSFTSHSPTITHFCVALTYNGMLSSKPQCGEACLSLEDYQSISSSPWSEDRSAVLTDGSVYHSAFGTWKKQHSRYNQFVHKLVSLLCILDRNHIFSISKAH